MHTPPDPHPSILKRLLASVGRVLTPEVAQQLAGLQADPTVQARVEALADQGTAGQLPADERVEYETSVRALECIAVLRANARRVLRNGST